MGGTLEIDLIGGFTPAAGDHFDLLNGGSWAGSFAAFNLPALTPGLSWDTSALNSAGLLSVVAVPEPSVGGLLILGAGFLVWRKRRHPGGSSPRHAMSAASAAARRLPGISKRPSE